MDTGRIAVLHINSLLLIPGLHILQHFGHLHRVGHKVGFLEHASLLYVADHLLVVHPNVRQLASCEYLPQQYPIGPLKYEWGGETFP